MGTSGLLRKHGRSNWYLRIYDPKTRREYRESAHTTDEKVAQQRLAEAERLVTLGAYVPPDERHRVAEREAFTLHRGVAEYLSKMVNEGASAAYTDNTAYLLFNFLEYVEAVERRGGEHLAPSDLPSCRLRIAKRKRTPREDVAALVEGRSTDRPARFITEPIVESYKAHRLHVADADATTVNNELKMLRMFGRWLVRRAALVVNPFEHIRDVVDEGERRGRVLTPDEFGRFIIAADANLRDWAIVTGLHGLRREETNHLRPADINVEEGFLDIRRHRTAKGDVVWRPKFGKERKVPIASAAIAFMRDLREGATDEAGHLLGVHDRRKARDRALVRAGICGHLTFHSFRHSSYTHMKNAAVQRLDPEIALADVRTIFGHSNSGVDDVYDHRSIERLRRIVDLSPLTSASVLASAVRGA